MRALRHVLSLAAVGLLLSSCAHAAGSQAQPAPGPGPEDDIVLDVSNHTWNDLDLYVYAGSNRSRVGSVVSMGTVHLSLAPNVLGSGSVQIRTEPVGAGASYTSERIDVHTGQRIRLTVEHQLSLSSLVIERSNPGW